MINLLFPIIDKERITGDFLELTTGSAESLNERRVADLLMPKLRSIGFSVSEDDAGQKLGGNTGNLYGLLKGTIPGLPLLFSAHMDTVRPGRVVITLRCLRPESCTCFFRLMAKQMRSRLQKGNMACFSTEQYSGTNNMR